jgi:hypothetical protein
MFGKSTKLGFLKGNYLLKFGDYFRFYHSIQAFGGSTPKPPVGAAANLRISFSVGCLHVARDTSVIIRHLQKL